MISPPIRSASASATADFPTAVGPAIRMERGAGSGGRAGFFAIANQVASKPSAGLGRRFGRRSSGLVFLPGEQEKQRDSGADGAVGDVECGETQFAATAADEVKIDEIDNMLVKESVHEISGNPAEDTTVIGPLIDEGAAKRVEAWVQEAVNGGAKLRVGGKRQGSVVEATVLTDVTPQMKVSCQEVFGPVVTMSPYVKFEDALAGINDSPYGLQAGVFTRDIKKVFQSFSDLDVGTVLINEIPTFRADHMPYGGVKDSGLGREGLRYAIEEMTEIKLLVLNLS